MMLLLSSRSCWQRRRLQVLLVCIATLCSVALALAPLSTPTTTKSFVELVEPTTKCRVILLGCLHGSQSSARDVRDLLEEGDTVVLELCASRVADLRRLEPTLKANEGWFHFSLDGFVKMVAKTSERRGWASGVAAAVLGGASGLQTALGGFEAGLEFTTSLDIAKEKQLNVILADQAVDETLRRVGSLPTISLSMLFQEEGLPVKESEALTTAVFGDDSLYPNHQVNMGQVLIRNRSVVLELLKLTLPPMSLALLAGTTADKLVTAIFPPAVASPQIPWWTLLQDFSMTPMEVWNSVGMDVVSSILVLLLGYVALALPATRVILCERDDQLTEGIRAACRSATENGANDNARVVAVLGLLHVNGVAKRLLQQQEDQESAVKAKVQ